MLMAGSSLCRDALPRIALPNGFFKGIKSLKKSAKIKNQLGSIPKDLIFFKLNKICGAPDEIRYTPSSMKIGGKRHT